MINQLAEKHGRSAGQILLKFQVQRGIIVIPKSQNQKRQNPVGVKYLQVQEI